MASKEYNRRFSGMSLTALRKYAKDVHGLMGLSKAPREIVQAAINVARQAKPMASTARSLAYHEQRFANDHRQPSWLNSPLTDRQRRRIRKHNRKAQGR